MTGSELEAELGQQVRNLRLRENRTQAQVARQANLDRTTLARIERGEGGTLGSLVQIARALGREDWLLSFAPAPTISPMALLEQRRRDESGRRRRARPVKA
jgi:transcriptional regulator with XRE-family HTH domain